jgi:tetratricopeptide (TPR) repeat protein
MKRFPTFWFNRAEAYFRLSRFSEAKENFQKYIELFPFDSVVWAAQLRLGEIAQLQLDQNNLSKSNAIESFYQTIINQHPFTTGEALAILRLSGCQGHTKSNYDFYANFFNNDWPFFCIRVFLSICVSAVRRQLLLFLNYSLCGLF